MATIELKDIGPVEQLSIPVAPGITVLRGRNGKGKSKTLEAVNSLVTGRGKLDVRDKALRGEVEGFGAKITVGRSTRRSGELECVSLEGRLNLADLVDPGFKEPEAADARRIKALVSLAGVKADPALFVSLIGERPEFEAVVSPSSLETSDVVEMAAKVKRDLEAAARKEEDQAEHESGHAQAHREAAGDVAEEPASKAALESELEAAVREQTRLDEQADAAELGKRAAEQARAELERAEKSHHGPSVASALEAERIAQDHSDKCEQAVREAEQALADAQKLFDGARHLLSAAIADRKSAEQHAATISRWRGQIDAARPAAPTPEQVTAAAERVKAAREAIEAAAVAREKLTHLAQFKAHDDLATRHAARAEVLRTAAKGTDEVLSGLIERVGSPLRVSAGRLTLQTNRGETYFHELSHGERWKLAIDLAVDVVGQTGLITLPQDSFESLDPINRRLIANHAKARGVCILTAEASEDDEIRAEEFA